MLLDEHWRNVVRPVVVTGVDETIDAAPRRERRRIRLYWRGTREKEGVSQAAVAEILALVLRDRTFAERLRTDPDGALGDFDLTEWEREAILLGAHQPSRTALLEERPRTATRLL